MDYDDYYPDDLEAEQYEIDSVEEEAVDHLRDFFKERKDEVFFSKQLEVQNEKKYFHWITNRAVKRLLTDGLLASHPMQLKLGAKEGGRIIFLWHRSNRYYKRQLDKVFKLVSEYSTPDIGKSLGQQGEKLVLEAFAKNQFLLQGMHTREYKGKEWSQSGRNLDFIFERDSVAYGIEVKNTLSYMDSKEFKEKIRICAFLGMKPIFAVRMLPKTWIDHLIKSGGYALILKFQFYPWALRALARRIATELGLPVDTPDTLADTTMTRVMKWHQKNL